MDMNFDEEKVDDAVLALLWLTTTREEYGARAWKGHDWDAMDRLHKKGYISDPHSKAKSVVLTADGLAESERLFMVLFATKSAETPSSTPQPSGGKRRMKARTEDPVREDRIAMEIVVDAYDDQERAVGWHAYVENICEFPFTAICRKHRSTSPLRPDTKVDVLRAAEFDDCMHELFVIVLWRGEELAVPLDQLDVVDADPETRQAVEDWHYWVERGYSY
jgi:hypothetical protein